MILLVVARAEAAKPDAALAKQLADAGWTDASVVAHMGDLRVVTASQKKVVHVLLIAGTSVVDNGAVDPAGAKVTAVVVPFLTSKDVVDVQLSFDSVAADGAKSHEMQHLLVRPATAELACSFLGEASQQMGKTCGSASSEDTSISEVKGKDVKDPTFDVTSTTNGVTYLSDGKGGCKFGMEGLGAPRVRRYVLPVGKLCTSGERAGH